MAARATLDSEYWFSHETAAVLHGLWTYRLADRVHLTQLYPPRVRREDDSWSHRFRLTRHWTRLPERDRAAVRGVPVTGVERTAVDCARSLPLPGALVVMDCALRHGADRALVARIIDESRGKRGVVQARRVLALADVGAESPGESLSRLSVLDAGLPRPETQIPIATRFGVTWIDLGWAGAKVGVEFDGEGWRLVRSAWPDIDEPQSFDRRLRRAFARRWHALVGEAPTAPESVVLPGAAGVVPPSPPRERSLSR